MPLSGLKVLDLCRARAGPTAVRQLADWGADVIKIELPTSAGTDPLARGRDGFDFQNLHRNKRSLGLNLKAPRGRELFLELAAGAGRASRPVDREAEHQRQIADGKRDLEKRRRRDGGDNCIDDRHAVADDSDRPRAARRLPRRDRSGSSRELSLTSIVRASASASARAGRRPCAAHQARAFSAVQGSTPLHRAKPCSSSEALAGRSLGFLASARRMIASRSAGSGRPSLDDGDSGSV